MNLLTHRTLPIYVTGLNLILFIVNLVLYVNVQYEISTLQEDKQIIQQPIHRNLQQIKFDSTRYRWNLKKNPIVIYVGPFLSENFVKDVISGWGIPFTFTDSMKNSNVYFGYDPSMNMETAGLTELHNDVIDTTEISHCMVTINLFAHRGFLRTVIAHEFGHVLGLKHTDDTTSVMYTKLLDKEMPISKSDLNSLKALYNLP